MLGELVRQLKRRSTPMAKGGHVPPGVATWQEKPQSQFITWNTDAIHNKSSQNNNRNIHNRIDSDPTNNKQGQGDNTAQTLNNNNKNKKYNNIPPGHDDTTAGGKKGSCNWLPRQYISKVQLSACLVILMNPRDIRTGKWQIIDHNVANPDLWFMSLRAHDPPTNLISYSDEAGDTAPLPFPYP